MVKMETLYKRAMQSKDADYKRQIRILYDAYQDRYITYENRMIIDSWDIEQYKEFLDKNSIEYIEIESEKANDKVMKMIIPCVIFKNFNNKDLNILFNSIFERK